MNCRRSQPYTLVVCAPFTSVAVWTVPVLEDATADYGEEFMHAALVSNLPRYARAMVTTKEAVDLLSGTKALGMSSQ